MSSIMTSSFVFIFFLVKRQPSVSTRTDTLCPYPTLFRSARRLILRQQANRKGRSIRSGLFRSGAAVARLNAQRGVTIITAPSLARSECTPARAMRSEEHTSELQSLMPISYAVFCLKKPNKKTKMKDQTHTQRTHEL